MDFFIYGTCTLVKIQDIAKFEQQSKVHFSICFKLDGSMHNGKKKKILFQL